MAKKSEADYTVGYKKPPRETQFKRGQSGNPKGRPKTEPTFTSAFSKELNSLVTITVGAKTRKIPMREAIAKQHTSRAAKGDPKSTAIVMDVMKSHEEGKDQKSELRGVIELFRATNDRQLAADRNRTPMADRDTQIEDKQP